MTSATSSGSGMPTSAAPRRISSRSTARANALSFIFLTTDSGGRSRTLFEGRTSAHAPTNPLSSSAATMAFSIGESHVMPV